MHTSYSATKRIFLLSSILVLLLVSGRITPVSAQSFPPPIYSPPPGSTLTSTTVTFTGVHTSPDWLHHAYVGSTPGGKDLYDGQPAVFYNLRAGYSLFTVSGLPSSGTIYVRYYTWTGGTTQLFQTHSYTMSVGSSADGRLNSTNGDTNGCNSDRFTCLWPTAEQPDGAVVRDNETGLVWERSPDTGTHGWDEAISHCANREVGGRKGFHLPMRDQLVSLVDTSKNNPALPTDHPFLIGVLPYMSATSFASNPDIVTYVDLQNGDVNSEPSKNIDDLLPAWCVRGGQSFDGQDLNGLP